MAKTKAQGGIEVPRKVVEFILLGPEDDRRQLPDSPILGDVWVEFARNPGRKLGLLVTPYKEHAAGKVARAGGLPRHPRRRHRASAGHRRRTTDVRRSRPLRRADDVLAAGQKICVSDPAKPHVIDLLDPLGY